MQTTWAHRQLLPNPSYAVKLGRPTDEGQSVGVGVYEQRSPKRGEVKHGHGESLIGPVNSTTVMICGQPCTAILDTGSQVTTITKDFVLSNPHLQKQEIQLSPVRIEGAGGQDIPHDGIILLDIQMLGTEVKSVPALVVPGIGQDGQVSCLLGTNLYFLFIIPIFLLGVLLPTPYDILL